MLAGNFSRNSIALSNVPNVGSTPDGHSIVLLGRNRPLNMNGTIGNSFPGSLPGTISNALPGTIYGSGLVEVQSALHSSGAVVQSEEEKRIAENERKNKLKEQKRQKDVNEIADDIKGLYEFVFH
jgi:hypothetical protein